MNIVIATYFALVALASIVIFFHVRNKLKDEPLDDTVITAYSIIWVLIACFSLLSYKFYTLWFIITEPQ